MNKCQHGFLVNNMDGTVICVSCTERIKVEDLKVINSKAQLNKKESCLHRRGKVILEDSSTDVSYYCKECDTKFSILTKFDIKNKSIDDETIINNIKCYNINLKEEDIIKLFSMNKKTLLLELEVALLVYEKRVSNMNISRDQYIKNLLS